jgi:hypothetical protein
MAKNQATSGAHRNGAVRDRSQTSGSSLSGRPADKDSSSRSKRPRREILFPTEPTTIPHEEIDRAIDLVMSRKK